MLELINNVGRFILHIFDVTDVHAVVLLAMLLAAAFAMWSAQKRDDFDWGDGFKDDFGKVSYVRMGIPVAIGISSWFLIYITMVTIRAADAPTVSALDALYKYYVTYLVLWSGTKIAERIVELAAAKIGVNLAPDKTVTTATATVTTATSAAPTAAPSQAPAAALGVQS